MGILFAFITGSCIWELGGLFDQKRNIRINKLITTLSGVYLFAAFFGFCSNITPVAVFIPYLVSIVYLFVSELYLQYENPLNNWAYTVFSQMYIALPLSLISVLGFVGDDHNGIEQYNYALPLSVFLFLWANDSGAYCFGSLFGKHKLFPRISPSKTWEGSIGGGILVLIVAFFLGLSNIQPLMTTPEWIGLGLTVIVFGTWGDLIESLIKRTLKIKDSGNILPGHGGMLDRFDSSLLAIPAAVIYLYTITLF